MLQVARPRTWGNAPRLAPVAMGRIVAQLLPDNMAMARFTSLSRAASLRGGVVRVHVCKLWLGAAQLRSRIWQGKVLLAWPPPPGACIHTLDAVAVVMDGNATCDGEARDY